MHDPTDRPATHPATAGAGEAPILLELAAVRAELPRVDSKCGTLAGITMAGMAFLATQVSHGPVLVRALMGAGGIVLAAATLMLLTVVIRPRLGATGFRRWARMDPEGVRRALTSQAAVSDHQERDLVVLSAIVDRKYWGLRVAVELTTVAVGMVALAILAGVLS